MLRRLLAILGRKDRTRQAGTEAVTPHEFLARLNKANAPKSQRENGEFYTVIYFLQSGKFYERDITINAVWRRGDSVIVSAHDLKWDEDKIFNADNVVDLFDRRTGNRIPQPERFFAALVPSSEEENRTLERMHRTGSPFAQPKPLSIPKMRKELRDLIRPTAVLMMAIARSDGRISSEEIWLISDLVFEGARKTYTIWQTDMLSDMVIEVLEMKPNKNSVTRALATTVERGAFPPNLPEWLLCMARADGEVTEAKRETMLQMLTTLKKQAAARKTA